jgi:hypothetical protein
MIIRKLTPSGIKKERTRLLRKAGVSSIDELRSRKSPWSLSIEEHGILTRLESLEFLEGTDPIKNLDCSCAIKLEGGISV